MKKISIIAILVAALFALALVGCAGGGEESSSSTSETSSSEAASSGASGESASSESPASSKASSNASAASEEEADDEEEEVIDPDDDGSADDDNENVEPTVVDEVIADIEPVVIVDDDTCTITVTGRGTDITADPCYRIVFTNKTGSVLYLTAEDEFDVNGMPITAGIDEIAEPGETVVTTLFFPADELGGGLEKLVNVTGVLNVEIDDTFEPVADYPFHMD